MALAPKKPAPPAQDASLDFMSSGFYYGGRSIPEGNYLCDFAIQMWAPKRADGTTAGAARLVTMLTAYPLNADLEWDGSDPYTKDYSWGDKAHETFLPNEDGTGIVKVPGGANLQPNNKTNWNIFRENLMNLLSGEVEVTSLAAIKGVGLHLTHIPEPEERKSFTKKKANAASEAAAAAGADQQEERKGPGTILVPDAVLDGLKPWEGGGGVPEAEEEAPAPKAAPKKPAAAAHKAPLKMTPKAPAPAAEPAGEDDDQSILDEAITKALEDKPDMPNLLTLRTDVFKILKAKKMEGPEVSRFIDTYMKKDPSVSEMILGEKGYSLGEGPGFLISH